MLDGRVKTLHPKIFGGILGDPKKLKHKSDMQRHNLKKFDLVVVNLYPFEKIITKTNNIDTCIENIDVGGPSMIRAAAKNYSSTAVIVDIPSCLAFKITVNLWSLKSLIKSSW